MRTPLTAPLIFRVVEQDGAWSVEHEGLFSHRSQNKAEVVASATKLARAALSLSRAVQVRIDGETGYF